MRITSKGQVTIPIGWSPAALAAAADESRPAINPLVYAEVRLELIAPRTPQIVTIGSSPAAAGVRGLR